MYSPRGSCPSVPQLHLCNGSKCKQRYSENSVLLSLKGEMLELSYNCNVNMLGIRKYYRFAAPPRGAAAYSIPFRLPRRDRNGTRLLLQLILFPTPSFSVISHITTNRNLKMVVVITCAMQYSHRGKQESMHVKMENAFVNWSGGGRRAVVAG